MFAAKKTIDKKLLQDLVPLNSLSGERFREVADKIIVEEVRAGHYLFHKGDRDNQSIYLLEGSISLMDGPHKVAGEVEAGTETGRYPVANQQPRMLSARAERKIIIARIDSSLLDAFLTWDQNVSQEAVDIQSDENEDWMTKILKTDAFMRIPPQFIQGLLMKMQSRHVKAGDVIISQGDEGDFFYTIHEGRCAVTRRPAADAEDEMLAELSPGDSFGEEALVSDAKRNASVSMLTDGILMRLAKKDFVEFLKKPLVHQVACSEAINMVNGGAVWLDVRPCEQHEAASIEDSVNIPLAELRGEIPELVFNSKYVIYCADGGSSASAAFVLSHKGFDVCVLDGGLAALSAEDAERCGLPAAMAKQDRDSETLAAVIALDAGRKPDVDSMPTATTPVVSTEAEATVESNNLEAELETLRRENARLREQIGHARAELGEATEKLEAVYAREQQAPDLEALESEKRRLQEQLENARAELGESGEKLQALYARLKTAAEETRLARDQYADLQEALTDNAAVAAQDIGEAARKAAALEATVSKLEEEKQSALQRAESVDHQLQEQVAELEAELTAARQQLEQAASELQSTRERLEALQADNAREAKTVGEVNERLRGEVDEAREDARKLEQTLAAAVAETAAVEKERERLESELEQVRHALDSRQSAHEQAQDAVAGELAVVEKQLFDLKEKYQAALSEKAAAAGHTARQDERVSELELRLGELEQKAGDLDAERQAAVEALEEQQAAWEATRQQLEQEKLDAGKAIADLEAGLESLRQQADEARARHEQVLQQQVSESSEQAGRLEERLAGLDLEKAELATACEALKGEKQLLNTQLEAATRAEAGLQKKIEQLTQQANSLSGSADARISELEQQLEQGRRRVEDLEAALSGKDAAIETLHSSLSQQADAGSAAAAEINGLNEQLDTLRAELQEKQRQYQENRDEQVARYGRLENELSAKQAAEGVLTGQVEHLHEQLEQATAELRQLQSQGQEAEQGLREALDEERKARTGERAEMAARQRELKEQLSLAAAGYEESVSRQSQQLQEVRNEERQRLEGVLEQLRADSARQVEQLRRELEQAHGEIQKLDAAGKSLRQEEDRIEEMRLQQNERMAREFESRIEKLVGERDSAVDARQALAERIDALQGELAVARGLLNKDDAGLEDPAVLSTELEEVKRNFDIAVRLRGEAESARDRLEKERDELMVRLENRIALEKSVGEMTNTPVKDVGPDHESEDADVQEEPGSADRQKRPGVVAWVSLVAAIMLGCAMAAWFMLADDNGAAPWNAVAPVAAPPVADKAASASGMTVPASPAPVAPAAVAQPVAVSPVREFSDAYGKGGNGPTMVELPAGSFSMGSAGKSLNYDEGPVRNVSVESFAISKFEVTFEEYDRFARATGRRLPYDKGWGRRDRPVVNVSWKDARAYTQWLSKKTGHAYRLPTEAEWEYAARAGTTGPFWWPKESAYVHANCFNCGSEWDNHKTAEVGSFDANPFGLHDTAGNVQEWIEDCYQAGYDAHPGDASAWTVPQCTQRVVRGGSYTSPLDSVRNAKRGQYDQDTRLDNIGFRIVRAR